MKHDDNNTETITHLSLCSGYEGIGLGLRRVLPNLREIAYVEREGFPVANLVAKMEAGDLDAAPVFTDVKTFPYRKFRGLVDILSGGFPCQPFSNVGKREGVEDPRHLFPYIRDGIRDCKPRIVFLENVEGIISSKTADGDSVLRYVFEELEGLGYRAEAGIFSASEVGAPHQRKRVFILGISKELANHNCQRIPQHTLPKSVQEEHPTSGHSCDNRGIVANPNCKRLQGGGYARNLGSKKEKPYEQQSARCGSTQIRPWPPEPRLGRVVDGCANRVDRIRLLGNGVVPAVAAKAFVTLINQLT